ncbi:MAG TPA: M14 family zinc carboxypeptidase [Gaiella sp.]|nr:M14 family zinc carboxypeptidase [Gaiella sp.]
MHRVVIALAAVALVCAVDGTAADRAVRSDRTVTRVESLGHSVRGRPITVLERGDPDAPVRALVVGSIHGNEPAGIGIVEQLESMSLPSERDLWTIEAANPDGVAADTRTNAHGVDLNRNFPWRWRPRGHPGDLHYSGSRPLSEPESRLLARLIQRIRPQITVWFHQSLGVVDESGGSLDLERRFASLVGLPLRRLPRYPGGVTDWQNHRFPGTTAFVVELPAGTLGLRADRRYARAVSILLRRS